MARLILFVVALPAEAKPIIKHYQLVRDQPENGFPMYRNDQVVLIQSGIGKLNAAAAVAHLAANVDTPGEALWLNVGIAGHASINIGELVIAVKVTDEGSDRSYYPVQLQKSKLKKTTLLTVDRVSGHYPDETALDMEASGFVHAATRYTSLEYVHCLKIVSDNQHAHLEGITPKTVAVWMQDSLPCISDYVVNLEQYFGESESSVLQTLLNDYFNHWRFTATQKNQLKTLLSRWRVLAPEDDFSFEQFSQCQDGRALMRSLDSRVNAIPYIFEAS